MDYQELLNLQKKNPGVSSKLDQYSEEGLFKISCNLPKGFNLSKMDLETFYENILRSYKEVSLARFFRKLLVEKTHFTPLIELVCLHDTKDVSIKTISRDSFKCLSTGRVFDSFENIPYESVCYLRKFADVSLESEEDPFFKDFLYFLKSDKRFENSFGRDFDNNKLYLLGASKTSKTCLIYSKGVYLL